MSWKKLIGPVLAGGFTGASFDFLAACLMSNKTPYEVAQVVSMGWYGKGPKGLNEAIVGYASHYAILVVAAAIYAAAGLRFPVLWKRPVASGIVFGIGIFVTMRFIVLPLTPLGFTKHWGVIQAIDFASNVLLAGLPIAIIVSLGLRAVARERGRL